jgi:molybdopterin-binding protein
MTAITVRYPEDGAILDVADFDLVDGVTTVVFGPNGAGKTTLLRQLAGIGGNEPNLQAAYQPQNPYVFRGSAGTNLGLGLNDEEAGLAGQYADAIGIREKLPEPSSNLSAGERQRLSLARTLAGGSEWTLLDEPLSAIDLADRQMVLGLLASSLAGRSAVVVTHDLDVAVALADQLVVLDHGRILQHGSPAEVMASPDSADVARIIGVGNLIDGVGTSEAGFTEVATNGMTIVGRGSVDGPARAMFPAESVLLGGDGSSTSARNSWSGRVVRVEQRANVVSVTLDVGFPVVALVTPGGVADLALEAGRSTHVAIKANSVTVVPS